jgi:NAD(P)-dependent dehydrogenase (short-subunit alcohol dehydrogenase family)
MQTARPVAVVTGGARNLGKAIALRLARDGYVVVIAVPQAEDPEGAEATATLAEIMEQGGRALTAWADVRFEDQVQKLVEFALSVPGRIDVLVNNAGIAGPHAPVERVALTAWNDVLAVNLTGAFLCSRAVIPTMQQQRSGRIINIASIAGKIAYPLRSPYAVSKWGMIGLTLTLAKELGSYNVQVNAVCPGPVEGQRMRGVIEQRARETGQSIAEVERYYSDATLLKRLVDAEDVAAMVAYLASPAGKSITGQTLDVTCGYGI